MNNSFFSKSVINGYWGRNPTKEWLALFSEICAPVNKGVIADLGCGSGIYGRSLKEKCGFSYLHLVDSSPAGIEKLNQSTNPNEQITQSDVLDWKSPTKLDFILLKSLVHHVKDKKLLIHNLAGQLSKGGKIAIQSRTREQFLTTIELEFFLNRLTSLRRKLAKRYPTFSEINSILKSAGLNVSVFSYIDVFNSTVENHLSRLSQRRGNSVFLELSGREHKEILKEAIERYANQQTIQFFVPMTVWVGTQVN